MIDFLKSKLLWLAIRHGASTVSGYLIAKGVLANDTELEKVLAALSLIYAVAHSAWDKRAEIAADISKVLGKASAIVLIAAVAFSLAGCAKDGTHHQVIEAASGSGVKINAAVPIPYSAGQTLIGLSLTAGAWKSATAVQPTSVNSTNATWVNPNVAVDMVTTGAATVGGNSNVGTGATGTASLDGNGSDRTTILIGTSAKASTSGTNSAALVSGSAVVSH